MKKLAAILIISSLFTSACSKQVTNENSYQEEDVYSLTCNNKVIYENAESITLREFHWQIVDHDIFYSYTPILGELCVRTKHTIKGK